MAGQLSKSGHEVAESNRMAAKAAKWINKFGDKTAKPLRDAAKGKEIVLVCVGNDHDLHIVVLGDKFALVGRGRGTILLDNTTESENAASKCPQSRRLPHRCAGFWRRGNVENCALTVLCSVSKANFDEAEPVIDCYARQETLICVSGSE